MEDHLKLDESMSAGAGKERTGMKRSLEGQQAEIVVPFLISNGGTEGSLEVAGYALGQVHTTSTEVTAICECVAKAIGESVFCLNWINFFDRWHGSMIVYVNDVAVSIPRWRHQPHTTPTPSMRLHSHMDIRTRHRL